MIRSAILLALAAGAAAAETWRVVPEGSSVAFAGASTLHDFAGSARLRPGGALRLDGAASGGAVVAEAASMDTASSSRDKKMRGEVMDVAAHPDLRFDLQRVAPASGGGWDLHGLWTMHGATRPVVILATIEPGSPAHGRARFTLDIRRWGIEPPSVAGMIRVDPLVTVALDLVLVADATAAVPALPPAIAAAAQP